VASDLNSVLDRRRLIRSLSRWRLTALIMLAVLSAGLINNPDLFLMMGVDLRTDHIAKLTIVGETLADRSLTDALGEIADDPHAKALILHIDSPGGTTTGAEELYHAVRRVAAAKPVVATLGTMAASGGYIVALSADRIIARETSITGSIGVIYSITDLHKLMDMAGVKVEAIKSAPLKGEPNGFTAVDDKTRKAIQSVVDDSYRWFLDLVVERRSLSPERARELGDGRIYTGRQALQYHLVDQLGGEDEALDWLESEHQIDGSLPVIDGDQVFARPWYEGMAGHAAAAAVREVLESKAGFLDGLRSVWHAEQQSRR